MVTVVLAEEVKEAGVESEIGQNEVAQSQWHYFVPCAGVRVYSYEQALSPVEDTDPWALDDLTMRI